MLRKTDVGQLLMREAFEMTLRMSKDFGDGIFSFSPFAKHVFRAWHGIKVDAGHTCAFLSAVVLLLHHQIEFIEAVHPRAVLLLVIFKRLQKANHCHAALMFELFH